MKDYIIDSHAHLDDERFDEDRQEIIDNLDNEGIRAVINPSCDIVTARKAVELATNNSNIYAMVGTHPHDAKDYNEETKKEYIDLSKNKKVVAVGEIGLDYYYDLSDRQIQKEVFIDQIQLAKELGLPIVIHSRDAFEDSYEILSKYGAGHKVLLHAFSGSWEVCQRYLNLGFKIAIGGVITFKNAKKLLEVGEKVPLDSLLLETDSPYLTPTPFRGKRNQPAYTRLVAEKIAELKGIDVEEVTRACYANTVEFFGLDI